MFFYIEEEKEKFMKKQMFPLLLHFLAIDKHADIGGLKHGVWQ